MINSIKQLTWSDPTPVFFLNTVISLPSYPKPLKQGGGCGIRRIASLLFLSGHGRFRQENHGQLFYGVQAAEKNL